ncbi:hypothetical protein DPMN_171663 [Dreissena polymorpha]|uniref:Uncharacterized protein n=1 Tax=Dreissena polymorpha TaxID=45954 RepID=A0A9D4DZJ3_DREPO|nr:hypothetical protein DPMN_171663 [Dreissena polymorpha]
MVSSWSIRRFPIPASQSSQTVMTFTVLLLCKKSISDWRPSVVVPSDWLPKWKP